MRLLSCRDPFVQFPEQKSMRKWSRQRRENQKLFLFPAFSITNLLNLVMWITTSSDPGAKRLVETPQCSFRTNPDEPCFNALRPLFVSQANYFATPDQSVGYSFSCGLPGLTASISPQALKPDYAVIKPHSYYNKLLFRNQIPISGGEALAGRYPRVLTEVLRIFPKSFKRIVGSYY